MTSIALTAPPQRADAFAAVASRVLIAAGGIFGSANLFQWAVMDGRLPLHPAMLSLSWPLAVTAFLLTLRRLRRGGGEGVQRALRWSRLFILSQIAAALTLAGLSAWRGDWTLMYWMSPMGLSLYAIGWGVTSLNGGGRWAALLALGATATAAAITQSLGAPTQYLIYALGLFAFVLFPGLVMAVSYKE